MDPFFHLSGHPKSCKWCGVVKPQVVFESSVLCSPCHAKALSAQSNPSLCDLCASLFASKKSLDALTSEDGFESKSLQYFRESAERGCTLCRIFLLQDPNPADERGADWTNIFAEIEGGEGDGLDIKGVYFWSMPDQYRVFLSVAAEEGNPAAKHIRQRPQERNLGALAISEQIHTWLHECTHIHDDPPNTKALNYRMPTRVIDVGVDDGESVRLFEPPQTMREEYVALSYCWGDIPFIKTLLKNVDDHRTALVVSKLPQTFKDAIVTTHSLGFRYIWIDALCIIQDSPEDRDKELSAMRDIYSFANVTITAVCAGSVFDGFLQAKPQLRVELPFACPDGEMGSVLVEPQKVTDLWQQRPYTRAWCLQENLLSPRVLLFCDGDVVWQCQTTPFRRINNKIFVYGDEDAAFSTSPFRRLPGSIYNEGRIPYSPIKVPGSITADPETELKTWKCIVENYTRRRLSHLPDRLPALAGVAEKFQKAWTDEYFAGLWKRHFISLLTWRRSQVQPIVAFEPLGLYRAPTWSWASIEGPVEYVLLTEQSSAQKVEAKFESCFVSLVNPSLPFGQLQSAKLELEVSMVPWSRTAGAHDKLGHSVYWDAMERPAQGDMDALWDMFLCEGRRFAGKSKQSVSLVLRPVEGEEDTFRRVAFSTWTVGWNWKPWSRVPRRTITIV